MTEHIPEICAAFEMWQNNDCIKAGTTLELVMRYLADDPKIDHVVSTMDQDIAYRDYIGRQNENLNAKTSIIRDLKSDYELMRTNYGNTVAKPQDDIKGLKEFGTKQPTTEPLFNEECVGCCKVVDVAAKLQEELDSTMVKLVDSRNQCGYLSTQIEYLQKELGSAQNMYRASANKCLTQSNTIDELQDDIRGIKADRTSIKSDRDIMFQNYRNMIAKLQDDIRGLEVELSEKQEINDNITSLRVDEVEALYNLKAELSARNDDYEVLGKVVEIVREWGRLSAMVCTYDMRHLRDVVKDYLDAPEGPPETPIDDLYTTRVSVFLEMP